MSTESFHSGDINQDGHVDRSDLALLQQVLNECGLGHEFILNLPEEELKRLDVNQDGTVNQADIERICLLMMTDNTEKAKEMAEKFRRLKAKTRA